jgi:hypothetical protein
MNHKIRIAIQRVDTLESGTRTSNEDQLEGSEFQFTSKDQVQKYLEDARKTMDESQIKVLLTSLGVDSVDAALTVVASMSDEEALATFKTIAECMKKANPDTNKDVLMAAPERQQPTTDVNMPIYTTGPTKQKVELTNTDADQVKRQIENYVNKQLDQIKTQDGSSLRDWVHQEGDIQKVLTSPEFKVKQLGYKLLTSVESFVKSLQPKAPRQVDAFIEENGKNIRDWFSKLQVTATKKTARVSKLASLDQTATFTRAALTQLERIETALKNPQVVRDLELHVLGDGGAKILQFFINFDGRVRSGGFEFVLNEEIYDMLLEFNDLLSGNFDFPALQNVENVINQLQVLVDTELTETSDLNHLGDNGKLNSEELWDKFREEEDPEGLLENQSEGSFDVWDENDLLSVEWEEVLEDPEGSAHQLSIPVEDAVRKAEEMQRLNAAWDHFQDEGASDSNVSEKFTNSLDNLDQQWYRFSQEQVLSALADTIEAYDVLPQPGV